VLHVRVLIPLKHTDTVVDGFKTLLWTSDSELDHSSSLVLVSENSQKLAGQKSYLIRRQLIIVSLIGNQVTEFHREHTGAFSDDQGEIPELEVNVVGALEVVVDCDLLFGVGLPILELEDGILSMGALILVRLSSLPGELLDRIDLIVCKVVSDIP